MKNILVIVASLFALSVIADEATTTTAAPAANTATEMKHEETAKVETKTDAHGKKMKKSKKKVEHKEEAKTN